MVMEASFKTSAGKDPATYILDLAGAVAPTEADVLYAAGRQRERIVDRTYRGVDVNGNPFEPYSRNGPYYYYPNGRVGRTKAEVQRNKNAVRRLMKITDVVAGHRWEALMAAGRHAEAERASVGGVKTRDGQGIRFESYADFKASLGRRGVDLTGPRAPHMLQMIEAKLRSVSHYVVEFVLGIYGDAAGRASGHNTGYNPRWKGRHQRYFFGASTQDLQDMVGYILKRMKARLRGK
jgi:hypothetical protein